MLYDNKGKIRLPNLNLGLYVVQNYLIEIAVAPVNQRAPQRVASERMATHQERTWYGADPGPEEAAHLHYRNYKPRVLWDPWVQHAQTQEPTQETWPEGPDHQWANPPFHTGRYFTDPFGASGSRPQPQFDARRYSDASYVFSGDYYQEAGTFFNCTDNTLLAIQDRQAEHGRLLEQQQKWNQDHATAVQGLRQDTTTMNDNITTMMRFWNIK